MYRQGHSLAPAEILDRVQQIDVSTGPWHFAPTGGLAPPPRVDYHWRAGGTMRGLARVRGVPLAGASGRAESLENRQRVHRQADAAAHPEGGGPDVSH